MSTISDAPAESASAAPKTKQRRAAASRPTAQKKSKPAGWKIGIWSVLALAVGAGVGAAISARHYQTREIVAAVNSKIITRTDFYHRLEAAAGPTLVQKIVTDKLELDYAKKNGFLPSEQEVQAKYDEASKQPDFAQSMARSGQSPDDIKNEIRLRLARNAGYNRGVTVSDEDVRKFYARYADPKNPNARYYTPEAIQIAVIVTKTRQDADKALSSLNQGIAFGVVAKNFSNDSSKTRGGMIPGFYRGRTLSSKVPGLEETIFGMKIGERLGPKQFAKAWWIIQCLDKKPEKKQSFEEVKEDCRTGAMLLKGVPAHLDTVRSDFEAYKKNIKVETFRSRYTDLFAAQ